MDEIRDLARQLLERIEQCTDEESYRSLRDQLFALGTGIAPLLRENLQHPQHMRRMASATNLGRLGDRLAVPLLLALVQDAHSEVREMALFALGLLGDAAAMDTVLGAMQDYDSDVRFRALVALGDLGYAQLEDVLMRAMLDDAYLVREQALSQLRHVATPRAMSAVLKALLEREYAMHQMAEETLDRIAPKMGREHYKEMLGQLSLRERRLILNYLEARNLQEVYAGLCQRLQVVSRAQPQARGLDKYGRLLMSNEERPFLRRAHGRTEVVRTLVEHFRDERNRRSLLLVGEAGVGKTAIIHEMARDLAGDEKPWHLLETNTAELISGTRYLGDWETKLKEMAEVIARHERVIMYLTNPNDLLGAGAHSKSDENFADFFKPYLQRGQIRMLAECTQEDLKNGLARDPGFLRLFRQVKVQEMDDAQTLAVLEARLLDDRPESSRALSAAPGCLEHVVDFARSFFTRSAAPGRACDLMDALVDYAGRKSPETPGIALQTVDIAPCLSEVSGMSLDLLDDAVRLDMDAARSWFLERLVDQDEAVGAVVDRLAMVKAGLHDPGRPLGVYFLVGPTGVGKTWLAKLVAERLFGAPERMVRFDLSEYRGRYALEKLVGSPHDKDREGLLTEAVRNQPYCVLLFDEFEKADPEIFHLFLQIFDEGRLTDARGRTTDFRQCFIFLTSNLGASRASVAPLGFEQGAAGGEFRGHILKKLEETFAPEFLNRLDDVLVFGPLSREAMDRLVTLELNKAMERRGLKRRGVEVELSEEARAYLETHGFSRRFGARELRRAIERHLLTPLARLLASQPVEQIARRVRVSVGQAGLEMSVLESRKPDPRRPTLKRVPRARISVDVP